MKENTKIEYFANITANAFDSDTEYFFFLDLIIYKEDNLYIALCPSLELSSTGETWNQAIQNFYEAFQLHVECCLEMGTLFDDFKEHGWTITANKITPPKFSELTQSNSLKNILDSNKPFSKVSAPFHIPHLS